MGWGVKLGLFLGWFAQVICFCVLCIHSRVFASHEIFDLFFIYYIATDSISVILCSKYNALLVTFYYQRKIQCQMFLIRSWFVLLCLVCSRFVPLRGPSGGVPYMYMYSATHQILSFAYFSVYKGLHTVIIMQLGTL